MKTLTKMGCEGVLCFMCCMDLCVRGTHSEIGEHNITETGGSLAPKYPKKRVFRTATIFLRSPGGGKIVHYNGK